MTSIIDKQIKESLTYVQQLKTNVDRIGREFKDLRTSFIESLQTLKPTNVSIFIIFQDFRAYTYLKPHVLRVHSILHIRQPQHQRIFGLIEVRMSAIVFNKCLITY
jgi:hypothetical protein